MEYLIIGVAVIFNIVVIKIKFEKARYVDALVDSIFLITVTSLGSGSYGGLVVGTIASAGFSIYLMFSPPKFTTNNQMFNTFKKEFKEKLAEHQA